MHPLMEARALYYVTLVRNPLDAAVTRFFAAQRAVYRTLQVVCVGVCVGGGGGVGGVGVGGGG